MFHLLKQIQKKWWLAIKILPLVVLVVIVKYVIHTLGGEVIGLNALFTSVVAGTIFLLGFLISGVLTDYKEAEKIPGELSASLETLYDDAYTLYKAKDLQSAKKFIFYEKELALLLDEWFYRKEHTQTILHKLSSMNEFFISFDKEGIQPNIIIRMKAEQHALRKMIIRMHTIRDTDFVPSAYAIVEVLAFAIACGLVFIKIGSVFESFFFTILVSFLLFYMIPLIKHLDDPFDYVAHSKTGTEISLKPFTDIKKRLGDE